MLKKWKRQREESTQSMEKRRIDRKWEENKIKTKKFGIR